MNASCEASWYDGHTAQRCKVTLTLAGNAVTVRGSGIERCCALGELRIDPVLGNVPRLLRFPDGAIAETADNAFASKLERLQGSGSFFRGIHRWEMNLKRALAALLATLVITFGFVRYGLPFLATRAAFALPPATEELLGRETLQLLDRITLKPTLLPAKRQQELASLFATVTRAYPERPGWRLELRAADAVGANAFALPAGIVIVTDRLVELAKNDGEIAGVLAHEVGHVNRRHALRHLLHNSATALLVATLTGDITSVSSLAATMPTALIDAKFSRDFEREADDAAIAYLQEKGMPVKSYAEMLARLDAAHWQERETAPRFGDLLDGHPRMVERIQRILAHPAGSGTGTADKRE
jgi:Zn-dependent protease with chaperone function